LVAAPDFLQDTREYFSLLAFCAALVVEINIEHCSNCESITFLLRIW